MYQQTRQFIEEELVDCSVFFETNNSNLKNTLKNHQSLFLVHRRQTTVYRLMSEIPVFLRYTKIFSTLS